MSVQWQWSPQDKTYANYGNANQWTVNAGMASLARESAQNSNDAGLPGATAEFTYSFIRLHGAERDAFLSALNWASELEPHLRAMTDGAGGSVAAGQLGAGLEATAGSSSLVLLKISDYGCRGLTGPEFAEGDSSSFGNFIKLCRLDLFSGKEKAAGGSFGLGKAVYWRFSRLQTVLFHSVLSSNGDPARAGRSRVFGVNQGVTHRLGSTGYQGRGHFGVVDAEGTVESLWDRPDLISALRLDRNGSSPGTTALLVGFYDPDNPEKGLNNPAELEVMARDLQEGVEESFWPLLARDRLKVSIDVVNGSTSRSRKVDAADSYTELVTALKRFDRGESDESLGAPLTMVTRDIPIEISRRRAGDPHEKFVHTAKLVVTMSDDNKDTLENRVCLFRQPEMVVQTIDRTFEGRTFHAFLVAGAAINPKHVTVEDYRADDFLRFAEPPAHDRWIPGGGRHQASQANLTAHYVAPWVPNLRQIEKSIIDALNSLFGEPIAGKDKPPQSVLKNLSFLRSGPGAGGIGAGATRKPLIDLTSWRVVDGRWAVEFTVRVKNRPGGTSLLPVLSLVGLDGSHVPVEWKSMEVVGGAGSVHNARLSVPAASRARFVSVSMRATSTADLPIPAEESAIEVLARDVAAAAGSQA